MKGKYRKYKDGGPVKPKKKRDKVLKSYQDTLGFNNYLNTPLDSTQMLDEVIVRDNRYKFNEAWNAMMTNLDSIFNHPPGPKTNFEYGKYNDHYDVIDINTVEGSTKKHNENNRWGHNYFLHNADAVVPLKKTFDDPSIKYLEKYYDVGKDPDVNVLPLNHFDPQNVKDYLTVFKDALGDIKKVKPGDEFKLSGVAVEGVDPWGEITKDGKYAVINFYPSVYSEDVSVSDWTDKDEYATARVKIPLYSLTKEPLVNVPRKGISSDSKGVTPNMMINPLPEIYSRKLNQQTGEYIYDTSKGKIRKKLGTEDASFVNLFRDQIERIRQERNTYRGKKR